MRTRLFTLFIAIEASIGIISAALIENVQIGNLYYNLYLQPEYEYQMASLTFVPSGKYSGDISIPSSVEYESVTVPVVYIGQGAFKDCTGLTSVTIPNSVSMINNEAFYGCTGLTSVTIPNSVGTISDGAFCLCTGLTSITIPNSVNYIGRYSFAFCEGLTTITIPNSVEWIGEIPFVGCTSLTAINVDAANREYCDIEGVLFTKTKEYLIAYPAGNPNSDYTIPNSVNYICNYAFYYCTSLTSVDIPNAVTQIGMQIFKGCIGLKSITCEAITPPRCYDTFSDVDKTISIYVLTGSVEAYKAADEWKDFGDNIQPIQATGIITTEIQADPSDNSAVIEWPVVAEATVYSIEIRKNGELMCALTFNALGQLQSIAIAEPSRNSRRDGQVRAATQTTTGWQYTISGLEANTEYTYTVIAKKNASDTDNLYDETITFTTLNSTSGIDEIGEQNNDIRKVIHNGQLYILRDGEVYNAQGARVE